VSSDEIPDLSSLPRRMAAAVDEVLEAGELLVDVWSTRGIGANALVCAAERALIAKRRLTSWTVGSFPYAEIASVELIEGRPGSAVQLVLHGIEAEPPEPAPFDDFPDVYFQESRRLAAPNTVMFRSRRRAEEPVELLSALVAARRAP
jgi:hypothetical protein